LFAERVDKPVFFDNAFNYVEMPMEELVYRAGKGPKPAAPSEGVGAGGVAAVAEVVGQVAGKKAQELVQTAGGVPERVRGLVRSTRESTPMGGNVQVRTWGGDKEGEEDDEEEDEDEDEDEDMEEKEQKAGQGKKGWLGGWFGRG
jgi:signal recognition particle subunit SRP68